MDHGLGSIIGILEILEIEVFIFPIILEILEISVFQFLLSWKYWKSQFFNFPGILEVLKTFFAGGRAGRGGRGGGAIGGSGGAEPPCEKKVWTFLQLSKQCQDVPSCSSMV